MITRVRCEQPLGCVPRWLSKRQFQSGEKCMTFIIILTRNLNYTSMKLNLLDNAKITTRHKISEADRCSKSF